MMLPSWTKPKWEGEDQITKEEKIIQKSNSKRNKTKKNPSNRWWEETKTRRRTLRAWPFEDKAGLKGSPLKSTKPLKYSILKIPKVETWDRNLSFLRELVIWFVINSGEERWSYPPLHPSQLPHQSFDPQMANWACLPLLPPYLHIINTPESQTK